MQRVAAGKVTESYLRRILDGWRKEAAYRARVAFGDVEGDSHAIPAVWALYRAKLQEARRLEPVRKAMRSRNIQKARREEKAGHFVEATRLRESCPEVPVDELLAEYCRRAIARYTEPATVRRTFMVGPGVALVRA